MNGLDPANSASDRPSESDYQVVKTAVLQGLSHVLEESTRSLEQIEKKCKCLYSLRLEPWLDSKVARDQRSSGWDKSNSSDIRVLSILNQQNVFKFDELLFSRFEINRWIAELGYKSHYCFDMNTKVENPMQNPTERVLGPRERNNLLTIIGVLLELIQSPREGRDSQSAIINEMIENYSEKDGISERNLQKVFAAANEIRTKN